MDRHHLHHMVRECVVETNFKQKQLSLDIEYIENMISRRLEAKNNKDYKLADEIRNELLNEGIILEDSNDKTTWKKI